MIEALKSDEIVNQAGGRFKLTALIQRRLKELIVDGARPLVDREVRTDLELVIEEIRQGKCPQCWTPCEAYQAILANTLPLGKNRRNPPSFLTTETSGASA